jgi:hypothetical protein
VKGFIINNSSNKFSQVFAPLLQELNKFHWLIDATGGPFNITAESNFRELDSELMQCHIEVTEISDTSSTLWRPGVFRFAEKLVVDDFTTLIGIPGNEDIAVKVARQISTIRMYSQKFFEFLQHSPCTCLIYTNGRWEAYCADETLSTAFSNSFIVSSIDSDHLSGS